MSVAPAHKLLFGRLYYSVWNERRLEYIDQVIAETHALGDPTVSGRGVGPSAYRRQVERFLTGLPDLKFIVDDTVSEGEKLVVYWTITGTHRGEFLGVPPTNKRVSFTGITINQISNGKILESTVIWDGLGLMKQFGIDLPIQYEMLSVAAD
ncbi:MAG: ester cyclase [Candidatus Acidiferrum sp.]